MTLLTLAGCSGSGSDGDVQAFPNCALAFKYDGRTYYSLEVPKPVRGAEPLAGVDYVLCGDFGGQRAPSDVAKEKAAAERPFQAMTLEGIDPTVAFVIPSRWPDYIFFSGPSNATTFPPEVERLLNPWRETAPHRPAPGVLVTTGHAAIGLRPTIPMSKHTAPGFTG